MEQTLIYAATVLGTLSVFGLMFALVLRRERARSRALEALAGEFGMQFLADEVAARAHLDARSGGAARFIRGQGGRVENLLHGPHAAGELAIFESDFFQGTGRARNDYAQTVVCLRPSGLSPGSPLPWLALHPKDWRPGIVRALGLPPDRDRSPALSPALKAHTKAYAQDAAALWAALQVEGAAGTDRRGGTLEAYLSARPGWWIEVNGEHLFAARLGQRPDPQDLRAHVDEATALLERIAAAFEATTGLRG